VVAGLAASPARADLAEIRARGTLRVLVSADEDPGMFSFTPGDAPGLERELVQGFARGQGLKVQIVPVKNFDQILPALLRGEGDLVVGIIDTPERRKRVRFTGEILPARHLAVSVRPAPVVGSVDRLRTLRVGVVSGSSWADAARDAGVPAASTVPYADAREMMDALRAGRFDASVMSVTDYLLAQRRLPDLQAGVFLGHSGLAGWAVRPVDAQLLKALDGYLGALRSSQAWNRLVLRYFSPEALAVLARAREKVE
jgi:ABC-type amino acid transport substrate-binding protein